MNSHMHLGIAYWWLAAADFSIMIEMSNLPHKYRLSISAPSMNIFRSPAEHAISSRIDSCVPTSA